MIYDVGGFVVEKSISRSGKHLLYSTVLVYKKGVGLVSYTNYLGSEQTVKPIYSKGEAKVISVRVDQGDFIIYARFIKNFLKRIKGYICIYDYRGTLLYCAKYLNGFVARSKGDPVHAWLIRLFLSSAKIPVNETKLGDEK